MNSGDLDCTYHSYYAPGSWQVIEERNGSDMVIKQHIWNFTSGGYIDELVQTSINSNPTEDDTCDLRYYAMQDANFNVMGIVDESGDLVERYEYTPYGERNVFVSAGANDPQCMSPTLMSTRVEIGGLPVAYGLNDVGFQGLQHDEHIGIVNQRNRIWNIPLGRFIQPDPTGYPDGANRYAGYHVLHGGVDPMGTYIMVDMGKPPIQLPPGKKQLFVFHVQQALQRMCPCVEVNFTRDSRQEVTVINGASSTSPPIPTNRFVARSHGKSSQEFCDCLDKHKAGCTLVHDLLSSGKNILIRYTTDVTQINASLASRNGLFTVGVNTSPINWSPSLDGGPNVRPGTEDQLDINTTTNAINLSCNVCDSKGFA